VAFWEKTQTWHDLRLVLKQFHNQFGDLFLKLAPTRVTFLHRPRGGGQKWTPNELVSLLETPYSPEHPILIGEFVDTEGYRYVMMVNLDRDKSVWLKNYFPGSDVKIYVRRGNGQFSEGIDSSQAARRRTETEFRIAHWLAPGQSFVYRLDSSLIRKTPVKFEY